MLRSPGRAEPHTRERRRRSGRLRSLLAVGALTAAAVVPLTLLQEGVAQAAGNGGDVTANMFMWNWQSVASECTDVLGPKGYGAVQVSPPQDSIRLSGAHPWWEIYQPVGYDLNSRMGSEAQFASMVSTCHAAGVKVYADAVINHMSGADQPSTDSYGGDSFNVGSRTYSQVPYSSGDFHSYPGSCPTSNLAINDWNNQAQVQECFLSNLVDLNTESDGVRGKIAGYLNKLIGYGVDGFRVDAAKHINQTDMANIESRLNNTQWGGRPYILQEIALGGSGNLAPAAFEANGSVIGFDYANALKSAFQGSIAGLRNLATSGLEPSAKNGAMVTNHDTERNGSTLNYKNGSTYTLANEFMLAYGYGAPTVYSGFAFNGSDDSPPAASNGVVTGTDCATTWVCTDRTRGIANMVGWHNAAKGESVANWWDDGNNTVAFSRGRTAWIALNNSGSAVTRTFATGLAAGTYCDIIHGDLAGSGSCSGPTVTVDSSGNAALTVAAHDSVALYGAGDSTPTDPPAGGVTETFHESKAVPAGQKVYVVGSIAGLGSWDPAAAIALTSSDQSNWTGSVSLPANTSFEYKYIVKDASGNVTWEPGNNHTAGTGASGGTRNDTWGSQSSGDGSGQTAVAFHENKSVAGTQKVYVVGSVAGLGTWNTGSAIALTSSNQTAWAGSVSLPPNTSFEYKYILKDSSGNVTWESGGNRTANSGSSGTLTLNDTWK